MAKTPRFGLSYFGGAIDGSLASSGGKFTLADRLIMDRLFAAFETHDHSGGERLEDPTGAPTLVLQVGSGSLPGDTDYHYTVTYVDQFGLETAGSDEVSVSTPAKVATPNPPQLNTVTGGTLDSGTYLYGVTAQDAAGETTLSRVATVSVSDWKTVQVTPTMPTGATSLSIWRQGPFDSGFTRISTQSDASMFADDGSVEPDPCACDPENAPPNKNTTGATAAIKVTAPAGDLTLPSLVKRWRIYRTVTAGAYDAESLLVEISTKEEGSEQLVDEYVDDGTGSLSPGSPPISSHTLTPTAAAGGGGASGATLLLRSSGNVLWRMTATRSGDIETRPLPVPAGAEASFADEGVALYDSSNVLWRTTVSDTGQVSTTQVAEPTLGEVTYQYGRGPELATADGAVSWLLSVSTDGELTTLGQDDSTVIEGVNVRRIIASDTEPIGMQEGDVWLDTSGS